MATALITLSDAGVRLLAPLVDLLPEARLYVHESVRVLPFGDLQRFFPILGQMDVLAPRRL